MKFVIELKDWAIVAGLILHCISINTIVNDISPKFVRFIMGNPDGVRGTTTTASVNRGGQQVHQASSNLAWTIDFESSPPSCSKVMISLVDVNSTVNTTCICDVSSSSSSSSTSSSQDENTTTSKNIFSSFWTSFSHFLTTVYVSLAAFVLLTAHHCDQRNKDEKQSPRTVRYRYDESIFRPCHTLPVLPSHQCSSSNKESSSPFRYNQNEFMFRPSNTTHTMVAPMGLSLSCPGRKGRSSTNIVDVKQPPAVRYYDSLFYPRCPYCKNKLPPHWKKNPCPCSQVRMIPKPKINNKYVSLLEVAVKAMTYLTRIAMVVMVQVAVIKVLNGISAGSSVQ